jgi:hypothetical protein
MTQQVRNPHQRRLGMRLISCLIVTAIVASAAPFSSGQVPVPPGYKVKKGKDDKGRDVQYARTGHVTNYDESKVKPYTLPDPLTLLNGAAVRDADTWFKKRRPEILEMFRTEYIGHVPASAPQVKWEVASSDPKAKGGSAIMKKVVGRIGDKADGPRVNLTLYIPAMATGPVPVILTVGTGPTNDILSRGWAHATFSNADIQPDRNNAYHLGVIGMTLMKGQTEPAPHEWRAKSAWAWGVSRVVDYLLADKAIDGKCIAVQGHSRLGTTALWAGAQDERIAVVFASCSGESGASLARRDFGSTIDDLTENYPWQHAGNLNKWVGRWNEMPIDSHMLIALMAPRAFFCNGGTTDQWADPRGEFLGMVAAGPVYKLLGGKDLGTTELPPLDQPLITGDLGWIYHTGGHTCPPGDWQAFYEFAGRHFKMK